MRLREKRAASVIASANDLITCETKLMRDKDPERRDPEAATSGAPSDAGESSNKLTGYIAIGFGIAATFVWTAVGTLNSPDRPGASVNLHISVLVGLIGTAIGACIGLLIEALRRCRPSCGKPLPREVQEGLPEPPPPPIAPVERALPRSMNARSIHHSLMGSLQREDHEERWRGQIRLPLPHTGAASRLETDVYELFVYDDVGQGPSPEQERAFTHLQDNKDTICHAVRTWLFKYVHYLQECFDEPTMNSVDELAAQLSRGDVGLLSTSKDECAYVAFGFESSPDEEHGINVVVHKNTVLGIGSRQIYGSEDVPGILRGGWGFVALKDIAI
jgi:hypothetical protein